VQAVDTFGIVLTGGRVSIRSGDRASIEPTGTGARDHTVGTVSGIAGVQGALTPRRYSQHEVTESFVSFRDLRPSRTCSGNCSGIYNPRLRGGDPPWLNVL
jgi:hypothetical protein